MSTIIEFVPFFGFWLLAFAVGAFLDDYFIWGWR